MLIQRINGKTIATYNGVSAIGDNFTQAIELLMEILEL